MRRRSRAANVRERTLATLLPRSYVRGSAEAELAGIGLGDEVRVPTSDVAHAEKVRRMTLVATSL